MTHLALFDGKVTGREDFEAQPANKLLDEHGLPHAAGRIQGVEPEDGRKLGVEQERVAALQRYLAAQWRAELGEELVGVEVQLLAQHDMLQVLLSIARGRECGVRGVEDKGWGEGRGHKERGGLGASRTDVRPG